MADIKQFSPAEAAKEIEAGRFVIDTRFPFDYFGGRVPGSLNLPGKSLELRKQQVPAGRPLLIIAEDDDDSLEMCAFAASLGFGDVAILSGGIDAWIDADYQVDTISDGIMPTPTPTAKAD